MICMLVFTSFGNDPVFRPILIGVLYSLATLIISKNWFKSCKFPGLILIAAAPLIIALIANW